MSNTESLKGKVALITGASRGIGKEIALELCNLGANIIINYSSSDDKAEEVVNLIKKSGGKVHKLKFDVSKEESVSTAFEEIIKTNGTIDILVNNAGITRDGLLMRMKSEQWDEVINTNLKGVFLCTKYASKFMLKKKKRQNNKYLIYCWNNWKSWTSKLFCRKSRCYWFYKNLRKRICF